jgi:hypothetical protein
MSPDDVLAVEPRTTEPRAVDPAAIDTRGRTPLLAYGSNAAPAVLARKLGTSTDEDPVLAERTTLADFDVVYSAHVSRYGSIPATLHRSPGTRVTAFLVHVTEAQLALISPTEPNYELVGLRNASCSLEGARSPSGVVAYLSRHGALLVDDSEVALAEIEPEGRRLPALTQRDALNHVRSLLAPDLSLERFVAMLVDDPDLRAEATARLSGRAVD